MVRDHDGEYVIRVTKLERDLIEGIELRDDGTEYNLGYEDEPKDWPIRNPHTQIEIEQRDLQVGDIVTVYVEFDYYTAVDVEHFTLHPRRLHERLLRIEKHLGLEN